MEGDRAFARRGTEPWEEVNDFSGLFAPNGDFLAFLAAVRDVREVPDRASRMTHYAFRVDGPAFAVYMRDQLEQHLREQGELPHGVGLDLPKVYMEMGGTGELWVRADGLPLRQALHLEWPEKNGDRVEVKVDVTFSGFEQVGIRDWGLGIGDVSRITYHGALFTLTLAFCTVLVVYRRSKKVYAAVALGVIISMVVTPLLQSAQAAQFAGRFITRQTSSGTQMHAEKRRFSWVFGANQHEFGQISVNLRSICVICVQMSGSEPDGRKLASVNRQSAPRKARWRVPSASSRRSATSIPTQILSNQPVSKSAFHNPQPATMARIPTAMA